MKRLMLAAVLAFAGCDWDAAEAKARCTLAGGCDAGGVDAGGSDAGEVDAGAVDAGDADAGTSDAGHDAGPLDRGDFAVRQELVLSNTATAFGLTIDDGGLWAVVRTPGNGTEVYSNAQRVLANATPPQALYANPEVIDGLLLGSGSQVMRLLRDGGVDGTVQSTAALVSFFSDGTARFSVWAADPQTYLQTVGLAQGLFAPTTLPSATCTSLSLSDLEVLSTANGGSAAILYSAQACPTGVSDVTRGMANGVGVQLISPLGVRRGFSLPASGNAHVGPSAVGFDVAVREQNTITVSHHDGDGGTVNTADVLTSTGTLELGDVANGLVVGVAQGTVSRNSLASNTITFTERSVFLAPLQVDRPIITLGPAAPMGRLGLTVGPNGQTAAVLWDRADGGVMLTTFR